MQKIYCFFLINILFLNKAGAQVGIGTIIPDPSAVLQLKSLNKGLLVPRIALTGNVDVTTILSPATSSAITFTGIWNIVAIGAQ